MLAEGEEEVGSEHLTAFIETHADRLACNRAAVLRDALVVGDDLIERLPVGQHCFRECTHHRHRIAHLVEIDLLDQRL